MSSSPLQARRSGARPGRRRGRGRADRGGARRRRWTCSAALALFSVVIATFVARGGYRVVGVDPAGGLAMPLVLSLLAGLVRETLFGGVFFRRMERLIGSWIALAPLAALFCTANFSNLDATGFAATITGLEAGVMLTALFMVMQAVVGGDRVARGIYGTAVSGFRRHGLLQLRIAGPPLLTGGRSVRKYRWRRC